jgi:hypothetical protein
MACVNCVVTVGMGIGRLPAGAFFVMVKRSSGARLGAFRILLWEESVKRLLTMTIAEHNSISRARQ